MLKFIKIQLLKRKQRKLRKSLGKKIDTNIKSIEGQIRVLYDLIYDKNEHTDETLIEVSNAFAFSLLTHGELYILSEKINFTDRHFELLLHSRLAAILIIGYLEDIKSIIGVTLIPKLKDKNYTLFVEQLSLLNSQFSDVRKKNLNFLKSLRNDTSAHKTRDAIALIDKIDEIDYRLILNITSQILKISENYHSVSMNIIHELIEDMARKMIK